MNGAKIRELEEEIRQLRIQHYRLNEEVLSIASAAGLKWVPEEKGHWEKRTEEDYRGR